MRFWIDNTNAQAWIRSKSPPLHAVDCQYLIRKLADLANQYKFYFWVDWIASKDNKCADLLSRNKIDEFFDYCNKIKLNVENQSCVSKLIKFKTY